MRNPVKKELKTYLKFKAEQTMRREYPRELEAQEVFMLQSHALIPRFGIKSTRNLTDS